MNSFTISIDFKSFLLGVLTVVGLLLLSNFRPANKPEADNEIRRFQVISGEHEMVIIDTKTGQFLINPHYIGQPRWIKGDFETLQNENKK